MSDFTCIFCKETFSETSLSEEHIFPESIGGRVTLDSCVCKDCNDLLGHSVDSQFVDSNLMKFIRFHFRNYLPEKAIPKFSIDTYIVSPTNEKRYPIKLVFSDEGIKCEGRYETREKDDGTTIFVPDTPEGRKNFKRIKNSKNPDRAEWEQWPTLPDLISPLMILDLSYHREALKIFLESLALKLGSDYVLDDKFDELREFVLHGKEPENYLLRVGWKKRDPNGERKIAHRICMETKKGKDLFRLWIFDLLRIDIHPGNEFCILPCFRENTNFDKQHETQSTNLLHIFDTTNLVPDNYSGPEIENLGGIN